MKMRSIVAAAIAVVSMVMTGCRSIPTIDTMYAASYAVGYTAGMIANESKISDKSRNAVVEIVNIVVECVPETNQTFYAAWTPIAQTHVDKLVSDGKMSSSEGALVMGAFGIAVKGMDYLFEVRYPKAKQYTDLVSAAINGGTSGFLLVFNPANFSICILPENGYDADAYNWIKDNSQP